MTTSTYTSPITSVEYKIVPTDKSGWFRYEIILDGHMVQFALTEEDIPGSVQHFENPGKDISSRFD